MNTNFQRIAHYVPITLLSDCRNHHHQHYHQCDFKRCHYFGFALRTESWEFLWTVCVYTTEKKYNLITILKNIRRSTVITLWFIPHVPKWELRIPLPSPPFQGILGFRGKGKRKGVETTEWQTQNVGVFIYIVERSIFQQSKSISLWPHFPYPKILQFLLQPTTTPGKGEGEGEREFPTDWKSLV